MGLNQVWSGLLVLLLSFVMGGLPLTGWLTRWLSGRQLAQLGTGNIGVSAAFYHGGTVAGVGAVLAEAGKGFFAVWLARSSFADPTWELIALLALVSGRYWLGRGAGTTNLVWGCVAYDWQVALLIFIIGGISFTLLRERHLGRLGILVLFPLIIALQRQRVSETLVAIALSSLLYWIYQRMEDDLDLGNQRAQASSRRMFKFFQGDRAILSLDHPLDPQKVGAKAAVLSQLKRWGYAVPMGWVLPPGDDPEPLIASLSPSPELPLVVRSSAIGEDSEQASAAGQYHTILQVTARVQLMNAIAECQGFYNDPSAVQYRQDRGLGEAGMAVLVQVQVRGVFSGVAFSRDPVQSGLNAVAIEALPGGAQAVVSGQTTPECYQVIFPVDQEASEDLSLQGEPGDLPPHLLLQVASLARELEDRYHGIPQDIEWSYDGQTLWLLQARPITTLLPIWTRKIAAEVIPGLIHPLTWSINRPLTCGVWGQIFTIVLGQQARDLDFTQTATLHQGRAYFNASLLGQIFQRMGLPASSLEFLTRGAKLGKPALASTLAKLPGLLKLLGRERQLVKDFRRDQRQKLLPLLTQLGEHPVDRLSAPELLQRIHQILQGLEVATYYSILAPLSAALNQAVLKVADRDLDTSQASETAALRHLQAIATEARQQLGELLDFSAEDLFAQLANSPAGAKVLDQWQGFLATYGYMSPVATDIAVPTWREDPQPLRALFCQYLRQPPAPPTRPPTPRKSWKVKLVQERFNLKGTVSALYSQLLAHLRWSFVALEQLWLRESLLEQSGDIFFLEFTEIATAIEYPTDVPVEQFKQLITARRQQMAQDRQITVPPVVYGNSPITIHLELSPWQAKETIQGIGASPGQVEGWVKVLLNFEQLTEIDRQTILVVPYTDAGWAPLLAHAGGLIAEVGGRLSHGAIVAREYGIPAVMEVAHATRRLQEGQRVRIDGQRGIVEIL
uniref:Pyruvate phosphate dikinase PEP/pyruvate-binding n=1 Tax=Cyanothece sp. (strain PCC 7425 / ATCC 29141) TaxID=395961 RepID=B8HLG6_CYAP4